MADRFAEVRDRQFDVVVIGGGVIGAGVARDAAMRGMSVALFEKNDYASGTTSGSTRLIHGGLRYLEMFDFGLVRMDLREREILLRIAGHLVKPLEFLVPFYDSSLYYRLKLRAGMVVYDLLSYDKSLPNHRMLNAAESLAAEPMLRPDGLKGSACFYDAQIESPERLTVENISSARDHGAQCLNYAEIISGKPGSVRVRDVATGEESDVRARVIVNAGGPWFDRVASRIEANPAPRIRTTKGVHLACAGKGSKAVVLNSPVDGRLFFVIPLLGFSWVSTTDTDFGEDPGTVSSEPADIEYLTASAGAFMPALRTAPVYWTNAGVRALVAQQGSESSVSRAHRIESRPGLVSILGGKITGYRSIAEEATDAAAAQLGVRQGCRTAEIDLPGTRSPADEQVVHLADYMMRRTSLSFLPDQGRGMAGQVARDLAGPLQWSEQRVAQEVEDYLAALDRK